MPHPRTLLGLGLVLTACSVRLSFVSRGKLFGLGLGKQKCCPMSNPIEKNRYMTMYDYV